MCTAYSHAGEAGRIKTRKGVHAPFFFRLSFMSTSAQGIICYLHRARLLQRNIHPFFGRGGEEKQIHTPHPCERWLCVTTPNWFTLLIQSTPLLSRCLPGMPGLWALTPLLPSSALSPYPCLVLFSWPCAVLC